MPRTAGILPNPVVAVLAYDGLCTFEFGCAVEVFGLPRPEMGPGWYRMAVVAAEDGPLRGLGGLRVQADAGLEVLAQAGTVVVPGWRGLDAPVPAALCAALREAASRGARMVSLCSGAFVLAAAGLLDGRRATTHWRYAEALRDRHPTVRLEAGALYVEDGPVLTAAGSAAALDTLLHLVRRDFGARAANAVARRLVVPPHRAGGQAQFVEGPVPPAPGRLAALLDRVRAEPARDWTVEAMAREAAASPRSLHRRFRAATGMTPAAWVEAARLDHARALLEEARLPVQAVAAAAGFGEAARMRAAFRARLGTSPAAYRERFRVT
ncbi:transcriptional regulator FtrA [Roseococcus sp. DSY-14]|uniref:transcriptional regulator FtrA n=1 Tax=Roseococcus sp. DSY-14 TaxID=3369650 RepID=UPI00387B0D4A